ncbi:uncharacterized protein LOC125947212 [Dermacentor silvarum]|uniref:uncharacterized protein LOC125947212 n=1 Tax=Dermacentor silvarum TaxID=543639 RepID=UPI0021008A60|nr:uncharacterized protein LOC125947212 [Dermacentor silvarum]
MAIAQCSIDVFEQLDDAARVEAYRTAVSEAAMRLRMQLRHEVRVVSERLDETEPLNKTRAVSQPALSTVPPVLPRLPADNIKELEAAVRDEAVAATLRKHLLQIGGKSLCEVASYAMKAVMAHPVQVLYSLHSRKGKRAFINLKLCRIVTDVICAKGGGRPDTSTGLH